MTIILTVFFIILCFSLGLSILIQQGKGDMGLGGLGGGGQMLFGGSGGQDFFEKMTWVMGAFFILGALGLTVLKTKEVSKSQLSGFISTEKTKQANNIPLGNNKKA